MNNIVCVPVVLPLAASVVLLALGDRPALKRSIALAVGAALLALAGRMAWRSAWNEEILVLELGGWSARLGIVWIVDATASIMLLLAASVGLGVLLAGPGTIRGPRESDSIEALHFFLMAGVNGCFVTGDLFNLFVFFEVFLMASYVQIALGARPRQFERAFPYVIINFVAGLLMLAGIGVVYASAGTVNLAELSEVVSRGGLPPAFRGGVAVVLAVFATKAALVPLFFWLPDSYPEAPIPISALFAGLMTEVGAYALFRTLPILGGPEADDLRSILVAVSALTMVVGGIGALGRPTIRGVLAFLHVGQVGYLTLGLGLGSTLGVAGGLYLIVHDGLAMAAIFLAGGIAERVGGTGRLGAARGLGLSHRWASAAFLVPALALIGMPPLSGFWGKLLIIVAGFREGAWLATGVAVAASLLTLAALLRVWNAVYWGEPGGQARPDLGREAGPLAGSIGLGALTVVLGLAVVPLVGRCDRAAVQLLDRSTYEDAVLGAEAGPSAVAGVSP
ncbi:complex I subunit 5 family protein [Tautonia plasticadhaerens]|uniref:Na(+)/H(+) antiporter subunit D n=1 Tax=Tautonia plasticadhaerens TaxID=2527974 RepID=A0A518H4T1_9BACT|nr:proton-conducting transporter membrane subunit [Tautonia plasticadhaerens]QDV35842.1 Na(+)/H(+) antiporter subunit D [Tautonia plasticadhaerens]